MRSLADNFVGAYGPDWTQGVVTDHVRYALAAGWREHTQASGTRVLIAPDGYFEPVLCGELVEIWTEDGPSVGRCGGRVVDGDVACKGHMPSIEEGWLELVKQQLQLA